MEFVAATNGLASSESLLMATAFLILFIALPPTLTELLFDIEGLLWLDDTVKEMKVLSKTNFIHTVIYIIICQKKHTNTLVMVADQ